MSSSTTQFASAWRRWLPMFALAFAALGASAQGEAKDPPGRVAAVTDRQGSVVFAPAGEDEWTALPPNRPLTQADRIWTDQGARVELHLGNQTLHVRDLTNLGIVELDDQAARLSVTQGSLNAHIREMHSGGRVEVGTPNLSARATQPGDWRIDVDPHTASTRVAVRSGTLTVYGEDRRGRVLGAGEDVMFVARDLQQVEPDMRAADAFDQWAAARNEREEQSPTARYVPREVVGYQQLDNHGTWSQDVTHGPVWYPSIAQNSEWAPYRQGRWQWIQPWGWTWVDDAPWGFAPFHYGRWAMIGQRWAWVPGRMGPRPVYAPALVAFVGGNPGVAFHVGNSPGVAWYPLAPGEAWQPYYDASPLYVRNLNRYYGIAPRADDRYINSRLIRAITSLRLDDFHRGRAVWNNWHRVDPHRVSGASVVTAWQRPDWTRADRRDFSGPAPRLVRQPPTAGWVDTPRNSADGRRDGRADTRIGTGVDTRNDGRVGTRTDTRVDGRRDGQLDRRDGRRRDAGTTPTAPAAPPTPAVQAVAPTAPAAPVTPAAPVAPVAPAPPVAPRTAAPADWERQMARDILNATPRGRAELTAQDRFYRDQRAIEQQQQRQRQQAQPAQQVQQEQPQQIQQAQPSVRGHREAREHRDLGRHQQQRAHQDQAQQQQHRQRQPQVVQQQQVQPAAQVQQQGGRGQGGEENRGRGRNRD